MTCNFEIGEDELRKALASIETAKERGFVATTAVFHINSVKPDGTGVKAGFRDRIVIKSHPTDPNRDWGSIKSEEIAWYRCVNDGCVEA